MPPDIAARETPAVHDAPDIMQAQGGPPPSRRGLRIAGVVAAAVALGVVALGILGRSHKSAETQNWTHIQAIPAVSVVQPTTETGARDLVLPGQLQAFYNAAIYSRVSGYVQAWYEDIGARVRKGELLALIDTPETDEQIVQARADLATAVANMNLARTTSERWARLLRQDAVSAQESEEKAGDYAAKSAMVQAAKANLNRLLALKGFSRILAPFDGVVTARRVDIGALVNAGAGATPNSELFDVAEVDKLRLYVRVPQVSSAEVRPGVHATLSVPELPGRSFPATVDTTANAIADSSGTLLTELIVANPQGLLKPGAYAQVRFDLPAGPGGGMTLPSGAILFRGRSTEVAVVGPDSHVHLQPVVIARDLGTTVEIASGLKMGERVVNNPPDSIADGQLVRVVRPDGGQAPG